MYEERANQMENGDGVIEDFYNLLWMKQQGTDPFSFPFVLPDTITFRNGKRNSWFFSNSKNHILRKKTKNFTKDHIIEVFTEKANKCGIQAQLIYALPEKEQKRFKIIKSDINTNQKQEKQQQQQKSINSENSSNRNKQSQQKRKDTKDYVVVDYFNMQDLINFINNDDSSDPKKQKAILQFFIEPEGDHNSMIKCIWSTTMQIFEKRLNNKSVNDQRLSAYERGVTFDGDDIYSTNSMLKSPYISQQLRECIDTIQKYVAAVTYDKYQLRRMVVFFKVDKNSKLNILWCNSIRSHVEKKEQKHQKTQSLFSFKQSQRPLEMNYPNINPEKKRIFSIYNERPLDMDMNIKCQRCKDNHTENNIVKLPYKYLIDCYNMENEIIVTLIPNKNRAIQESQKKIGEPFLQQIQALKLPPEFHELYPKMHQRDYDFLKNIPQFLDREIFVCSECYLYVVSFQNKINGLPEIEDRHLLKMKEKLSYVNKDVKKIASLKQFQLKNAKFSEQQIKQLEKVIDHPERRLRNINIIKNTCQQDINRKQRKENVDKCKANIQLKQQQNKNKHTIPVNLNLKMSTMPVNIQHNKNINNNKINKIDFSKAGKKSFHNTDIQQKKRKSQKKFSKSTINYFQVSNQSNQSTPRVGHYQNFQQDQSQQQYQQNHNLENMDSIKQDSHDSGFNFSMNINSGKKSNFSQHQSPDAINNTQFIMSLDKMNQICKKSQLKHSRSSIPDLHQISQSRLTSNIPHQLQNTHIQIRKKINSINIQNNINNKNNSISLNSSKLYYDNSSTMISNSQISSIYKPRDISNSRFYSQTQRNSQNNLRSPSSSMCEQQKITNNQQHNASCTDEQQQYSLQIQNNNNFK